MAIHVATIRALVNLRADLNSTDHNGAISLYIAAQKGRINSIKALLAEHGADLHTPPCVDGQLLTI